MVGVRPEALTEILALARVGKCTDVVDERVYPDIGDLLLVPGDRNAPRLAGTADAEIRQAALDEAPRLVVAEARQDEIGALVVQREQPVLVGRQAEEVVLLLDVLGRHTVIRTEAVDEVGLALEGLAADAVEPGIDVLVDVAVVVDPLQELLDEALVALVRGADEEVVFRIDRPRQLTPAALDDLIDERLWVETLLLGHAVHPGRVLVGAGQEEGLVGALLVMTDEHVRGDGRVRVAD